MTKKFTAVLSLALLVAGSAAKANTISIADFSQVGGVFTYATSAQNSDLFNDLGVPAPYGETYAVIYDFTGYVLGSASSGGNWTFVGTSLLGPVPPATAAPDNGSIVNLIWRYTGSAVEVGSVGISLGNISATSTLTRPGSLGWYATSDHDLIVGSGVGSLSGGVGRINTPSVPEGGLTASLLGLSMLGLSWARRFVKRA